MGSCAGAGAGGPDSRASEQADQGVGRGPGGPPHQGTKSCTGWWSGRETGGSQEAVEGTIAEVPEHDHGAIRGAASELDATGLDGAWDFTLSFSPVGVFRNGGDRGGDGGQPSGETAAASDPNGALTLPEAIDKQLGLKLEKERRPVSVLVIDHVEQKPTDN